MKSFILLLILGSSARLSAQKVHTPKAFFSERSEQTTAYVIDLQNNADSILCVYKAAIDAGYYHVYANLGYLYYLSGSVPQDLTKAAQYFGIGASLGDDQCKNYLAYFYYKGFGVEQDYQMAAALYKELAEKGIAHAEYFLGGMYRNGYGLPVNIDSAEYWLTQAAAQNHRQAIHELNAEPLPENRTIAHPELLDQFNRLQHCKEQLNIAQIDDISGEYTGYLVYRDFSKKYIHKIISLAVKIRKDDDRYSGTWTEDAAATGAIAFISGSVENNRLVFDSSNKFIRHDQYSYGAAEMYSFKRAALSIQSRNDSIYLSGDMQLYSLTRKEPGQPMFILLSRKDVSSVVQTKSTTASTTRLTLYPNPTGKYINTAFTLKKTCKVKMLLMDMNGKLLQTRSSSALSAGTHVYTFDLQKLAQGNYIIQLIAGNDQQILQFIKTN